MLNLVIMIFKHLQINQISTSNNPLEVDIPLIKQSQTPQKYSKSSKAKPPKSTPTKYISPCGSGFFCLDVVRGL